MADGKLLFCMFIVNVLNVFKVIFIQAYSVLFKKIYMNVFKDIMLSPSVCVILQVCP